MNNSQPVVLAGSDGLTVERNVAMVASDGVVLMADIYRPQSEQPLPVLLIRLPYDKTQAENITYAHPSWYAQQGYIVVCQDTRGRYASGGEFYPFRYETDDGLDAIRWAASLPGANGEVGMYGFSYAAATQLLPARHQPSELKVICPAMTGSQFYEGWTYNGGAFALGFAASWALSLGPNVAAKRGDGAAATAYQTALGSALGWDWVLPVADYPPLQGRDTHYFFDWLDHPTYDDYWRQWSVDESYEQIEVPALHIAGWYDIFLDGTIRNFRGLRDAASTSEARSNQRLIIGPWFHMPWKPLAGAPEQAASPNRVDDWQVAWFNRFLKATSVEESEPTVTVMMIGDDKWIDFATWPPESSRLENWYLHSRGRANSRYGDGTLEENLPREDPSDVFTYDPAVPAMSTGGHSCCFPFAAPMGPADQEPFECSNGILVYTTERFIDEIQIIGDAELVLFASTSAVDTDWAVRLNKIDKHGQSTNIKEAILRARYRESLSEPSLLEPHEVYEYRIRLGAIGLRCRAGERLRLTISSSDFPQWDRNMNAGGVVARETLADAVVATQCVLHDANHASRLILPIQRGDING